MKKRLKHSLIASGVVALLTATGGTAWALDRFVIPHVVITDVAAYEAAQSGETATADADGTDGATASTTDGGTTAPTLTDTAYTADDASITITTATQGSGDTTVTYYVADIALSDATVLRSAFADNQFGENITALVSDTAEANGAIFAVNGDYYGFRSSGIVIRNGVVYRDDGAREGLVFYRDGSVAVYDETQTTAADLVAAGAWNTLSFGPAIVEGGAAVDGIDDIEIDTNIGNHSIQGQQPRTAIGVTSDGHILIVVVDGRDPGYSAGVTMTGLADILVSLGATTAHNLDGGGSSELWFNGEVVNQPSNGGERATSDILYIAAG